ncbi:MAG: hypothetical protein JSR55_05885 [Proteobacteria bacterium]|nr:hypothetical protein [Pseudomonadota bacterium]
MNRNRSRAIVWIALAAMMLRALLPDGWMPSSGGTAAAMLTICTMDGPMRVALGDDGQPLKKQHNSGSRELCPFAMAQHFAAPVTLAAVPAPGIVQPFLYGKIASGTSGGRDLYTPQSLRGPPALT